MVDYIWVVSISFSFFFWGGEGFGKLIFMTRELECVIN